MLHSLALLMTLGSAVPATPAGSCATQQVGVRTGHSLAYDASTQRVVMFGGESGDATDPLPTSLWAWDGTRWTCLASDGPPGRRDAFLGYDVARRRLVLFGGRVMESGRRMRFLRDTWEWDGQRWTQSDTAGPAPRIHGAMAYDAVRRALVIHGGGGADDILRDTWQWDGARWREVPLRAPEGSIGDALMPTPRGVAFLIVTPDNAPGCPSGFRGSIFEPKGDTLIQIIGSGPGPCISPIAPVTAAPEGFLLYTGWNKDEPALSWTWSAGAWHRSTSAPTRRRGTSMAYDEQRRRVVLFGGDDDTGLLGDTWEWDGRKWSDRRPMIR
jgi:hypothetical protein